VCSGLLSLQPLAGREMSSSLRAAGRRPSVVYLIGAVVCLRAAPRVQLDGRSIISSCQSAATSEIVKRFWALCSLCIAALYQVYRTFIFNYCAELLSSAKLSRTIFTIFAPYNKKKTSLHWTFSSHYCTEKQTSSVGRDDVVWRHRVLRRRRALRHNGK